LHIKLFNASHVSFVFENTQLHRNVTISRLFLLNYTKMIMYSKVKQHFACFYGSKIVYDFSLSLFRPFLFLSNLDHTTCPDLLLVIEARRYKRISFSLLKDRPQHAIHTAIVSIYLQAIRRM